MYADFDYYREVYSGKIINDNDLYGQLQKSSDDIDSMTYNRIVARGFESLTEFQQDKVKKAVCQHADFVYQYGEYINMPLSGYSAGSISLSLNTKEGAGGIKTSDTVLNLLKATGLTHRRL